MRKLFHLFTRKELSRALLLLGAILVMAFLEVVGVASVLPFMNLVTQPSEAELPGMLQWISETFDITDRTNLLIFLGLAILILLTISNAFGAFTVWIQQKLSWNIAHGISTRLVRNYLSEPYEFFLARNSSDLMKRVLSEVSVLVKGVLISIGNLAAGVAVSVVIFILLILVDPGVALSVLVVLGGAYGLLYALRRAYITRLGRARLEANRMRFKTLNELLTGIKSVRVYGAEAAFYRRFEKASRQLTSIHPKYQLVAQTPRYIAEIIAFGGILAITVYLLASAQDIRSVVPMLGLYALAGYRLLPMLQKVFLAATQIRHNLPVVEELYEDLQLRSNSTFDPKVVSEPVTFEHDITVRHLNFGYADSDQRVLSDISVTIPKGSSAAFVGATGSGKSTLVDLIIGLLDTEHGTVALDGTPLSPEQIPSWQRRIGYVPQEVFLYDDTVTRNIALGIPKSEIDIPRLEEAARTAQIHTFITEGLADGYDTRIGERGVRLSGGQRQRLGLARALYRQPDVLVLDEATSALDGITEEAVVEALRTSSRNLTFIMIAHRLSTVKHADRIYLLEDGRIVQQGRYEDLMASNDTFRRMVELTS